MDVSMKLVEQQCSRYLTMFSSCLERYPETWHLDCERQKLKLAKCAESEPTIVKIKSECKREFEKYEYCMNKHPSHPHFCMENYVTFNKCAEQYVPPKDTESSESSEDRKENTAR